MPDLKHALDKALQSVIENQFNNFVAQLVAPTYNAYDKSTPIERFEHIVKIVLDAYDQAQSVIEKLNPPR
jgi:hypothetical protein